MPKIDYVIISSDDNSLYKDFYPIVAKQWQKYNILTYYINITNNNSLIENEFGFIKNIKAVDFLPTGLQAQIVRYFASSFIDGNILTSDIDMLPLQRDYFTQYLNELTNDNVIIYSGQSYGNVPYYPTCYILSHTNNFKKYLQLDNKSFEEYCFILNNKYKQAWNTDECFLYDQLQHCLNKVVIKTRDFSKRIDRSNNSSYDINNLQNNYYIDYHMPRPYPEYKKQIDEIIQQTK